MNNPVSRHFRSLLQITALMLAATAAPAAVTVAVQSSNPTPVAGGAFFSLTLTVNNPDAQVATNVVLTNPLPTNVVMGSLSIGGAQGGSFSCVGPAFEQNGTVICRAPSFAAGATAVITLVVAVEESTAGGNRTNSARVVSGGNQSSGSVALSLQNDASLTLSHVGPANARAGDRIALLTSVNGGGNSRAFTAVVNISVPAGTRFVGVLATGDLADACAYTPTSAIVSCTVSRLAPGQHRINVLIDVNAGLAPGPISSMATLTAGVGSVSGSPANAQITIVP